MKLPMLVIPSVNAISIIANVICNAQCATSRDKRMSTGSVSSNHSAPIEQADLGWKEGHILKGLKRLQMCSSKEASSLASVAHCKDCMTSNEGIYSFGVKCVQQGSTTKQLAPTCKSLKAGAGTSAPGSDVTNKEFIKLESRESSDQPTKEPVCLQLDVTRDDDNNIQEDPVKLIGNSGLFPSPTADNFSFLEGPSVKPGVSPTASLTHSEEKHKPSSLKLSDRNNNQERSTDRKSRLDHVKRQQGRLAVKRVEADTNGMSSSIQHSATRALSCVSVARQRSSSMEVPHCRDQAIQAGSESQDFTISESPQRKPKPQPCDSARKAFILRSKSADGGKEQAKHTHSPFHQKLIKVHMSKGQSDPPGHSPPSKTTNLSKTHCSNKGSLSKVEKNENILVSTNSKSLKSVRSPLASPVKHSKTFKPPEINECSKSPTKSSLQVTGLQSSKESIEESIYDNLPCSPRKQRRQNQHCDVSCSESRSPSPPPPPGRTTSLVLRPSCDGSPKANNSAGQAQSSTTGKATSGTAKPQTYLSSILQPQQSNTAKDNQQTGADGKLLKDIPAKLYHTQSSKMSSVSLQESPESVQLSMDRNTTCHDEHGVPSIFPSQSILQRSKQSISEPKLSDVLPQVYSKMYYHGIANNSQSSTSRPVEMSLPVNAKSHEAIAGQETSTFLVFGRHDKDDTAKGVHTYKTFTCDPQMIHESGAHDKVCRKIETRCNSLDSEPCAQPVASDSGVMLDWGFDEEGWLFKRSVSVSTRPPFKPVMGMNGAKARSQSFGARYMDRPSFNRSGKVRTQIKTHSGSSLNSLNDALPGSMSCSSSYHCPMNRSLLNNFLIEEGLTAPSHLGSSSERLQTLKHQREQARRLQIEQQFSSAFGEPVSEEPERQSSITTIEEKVMLGIEENLHKSQEQEKTSEVKQKSGSTLSNWFGFRKSKLPAPSSKKTDPPKVKEDKREQKMTSLLGGKQTKSDKKRDRRKSDGKDG